MAKETTFYPIAKTLLEGVYDDGSILSWLRGTPHLVRFIFEEATKEEYWKLCIKFPNLDLNTEILKKRQDQLDISDSDDSNNSDDINNSDHSDHSDHSHEINDSSDFSFFTQIYYRECYDYVWKKGIKFPSPSDISVNMMPFILGQTFEECKLPKTLQQYWPLIEICSKPEAAKKNGPMFNSSESELNKVCYLTVQESLVDAGKSQRRPGLHTDCPGKVFIRKNNPVNVSRHEEVTDEGVGASEKYTSHPWGWGGCHLISPQNCSENDSENDSATDYFQSERMVLTGGIYMASSIDNSCEVWNCKIIPDSQGKEIIGKLGDVEHLRRLLPSGEKLKGNQMYWMTDRTPHESLPMKEGTYRQFFRLVMSQVSLWYEDHSTKNPLGVVPDPDVTKIVKGSKFDKAGVELVIYAL